MGFRINRTYVLEFEGALEGLYVKIKSTPISVLMRFQSNTTWDETAELLAEYVLEWNYEDEEGKPLAIEKEAILTGMEVPVMVRIAREWAKVAGGITAPLDRPSTDGEQSLEGSLQMEVLSPDQ